MVIGIFGEGGSCPLLGLSRSRTTFLIALVLLVHLFGQDIPQSLEDAFPMHEERPIVLGLPVWYGNHQLLFQLSKVTLEVNDRRV